MTTLWDVFNVIWAIELITIAKFIGLFIVGGILIKYGIYLYRKLKTFIQDVQEYKKNKKQKAIHNTIKKIEEAQKKLKETKNEPFVLMNKRTYKKRKNTTWEKASKAKIDETAELINELREIYGNHKRLWEALWGISYCMIAKYSSKKIVSKKHVEAVNKKLKDLKAWKEVNKYVPRQSPTKTHSDYVLPSEIEQLSKDIWFLMEKWKSQQEIGLRTWLNQCYISLAYNKKITNKEIIQKISQWIQPLLKILKNN